MRLHNIFLSNNTRFDLARPAVYEARGLDRDIVKGDFLLTSMSNTHLYV